MQKKVKRQKEYWFTFVRNMKFANFLCGFRKSVAVGNLWISSVSKKKILDFVNLSLKKFFCQWITSKNNIFLQLVTTKIHQSVIEKFCQSVIYKNHEMSASVTREKFINFVNQSAQILLIGRSKTNCKFFWISLQILAKLVIQSWKNIM